MKRFRADLHIHTCLSPCAELDMTPLRITRRALQAGLDIIALSDHNSAENLAAGEEVARAAGITLVPAMEITSVEEAHVLALFGTVEDALGMQQAVYGSLPDGPGPRPEFGEQVVVNARDEVMDFNQRPLMWATDMSIERLVREIRSRGGLAVASHVDREAFSVISQLGFIPADISFDALEVIRPERADALLAGHDPVPRLTSSDAHRLEDVGARTTSFFMREATFEELALALKGDGGRSVTHG